MLSPLRRLARSLVLVCVFASGFAPARESRVEDAIDSVAGTEVRLRKLHLVRPDLIPYPIAYEVVC